ncbi:MAG: peptidylprolyl isomerase, partial [Candidatus Saccharimonadales bacterium]
MCRTVRSLCVVYALALTSLALVGCKPSGTAAVPDDSVGGGTRQADGPSSATPGGPTRADEFPTVVLETTHGKLTLRLDAQAAPRTAHNFLHYVESGFYNQTIFHQVEAGYVLLAGGYT